MALQWYPQASQGGQDFCPCIGQSVDAGCFWGGDGSWQHSWLREILRERLRCELSAASVPNSWGNESLSTQEGIWWQRQHPFQRERSERELVHLWSPSISQELCMALSLLSLILLHRHQWPLPTSREISRFPPSSNLVVLNWGWFLSPRGHCQGNV